MVQIILQPLAIPGAPFTWHSGEKWTVAYSFKYLGTAGETVDVYLDFKYHTTGLAVTIHLAHETLTLAASTDLNNPLTKTSTLTVNVPSTDITADPGNYDLILNVGGESISEPSVIILAAGTGNFVLDRTYHAPGYDTFNAYVDAGTYGFSLGPADLSFLNDTAVSVFADALNTNAQLHGSSIVSYEVYRDINPANPLTTPYQIKVWFKSPNQSATTTTSLALAGNDLSLTDDIIMGIIDAALIVWLGPIGIAIAVGLFVIATAWHAVFSPGGSLAGIGNIITQIIPLVIVMLVMKMMMEGMQPAGTPKPVTDKVVSGAKAVGRGALAVGRSVAPVVGGFIGDAVGGPVGGVVGTVAGVGGAAVLGGAESGIPNYGEEAGI
jgi:hypothetical protein